jgi:helicase
MEITSLPLPEPFIRSCHEKGIYNLYPPQGECIKKGLLEGKNLLISIPTASGKTLLAEMAMWAHSARGGKSLYIVPLRALATEKYDEFSKRGGKTGVATGDLDRTDSYLGSNDIIVATSEKVDSLLRNRTPWLSSITLMILDEVHLIGSEHRGATLEMVITKMRYANPQMQVIGLSATIGNPKVLASWMDADLVTSSWRPVDLRQGVYFDGKIHFGDDKKERTVKAVTKHNDLNLCIDTIEEGGQCLVFVSSRRNAEAFAKKAASALKAGTPDSRDMADRLRRVRDADGVNFLAECVERGAAFHHAGLVRQERQIIEEGFRQGYIEVISATPTLAAGLNLPARRVIIRDYTRFTSGLGMIPIPVMEYHQMAGRAGRPHLDPYGESVLIAKDKLTVEKLFEFYIEAGAEEIESQCSDENALCAHILSLIATGFSYNLQTLTSFMERTFYAHQHPKSRSMARIVEDSVRFLAGAMMILSNGDEIRSTTLGSVVSQLYLDPHGARLILDILSNAEELSDIGILHLICFSPDMPRLFLKTADTQYLKTFLYKNAEELTVPLPYDSEGEQTWLSALKTALVLADWADELSEEKIEERYSIGAGDIYNVVDSARWLLHATDRLVGMELPEFGKEIGNISTRVQYGVKEELIPLVRLKNIGRVRARRLFNAGITSPAEIKKTPPSVLTRILGKHLTQELLGQEVRTDKYPGDSKNRENTNTDNELTSLPGIGAKLADKLKSNGISTISDMLKTEHGILASLIGSKKAEKVIQILCKENEKQGKEKEEEEKKMRKGQWCINDFE